ncbi:MAG: LytTR family DNA-binding domain-containing protein [Bacteroidota bacterium]
MRAITQSTFDSAPTTINSFFRGIVVRQTPLEEGASGAYSPPTIMIKKEKLQIRIPVKDILFVKAEHVYSRIHLVKDQRILQRISLESLLEQLPQDKFLRVHRSFIINLDHVQKFNSTKVLLGNTVIPIGRSWKASVVPKLRQII